MRTVSGVLWWCAQKDLPCYMYLGVESLLLFWVVLGGKLFGKPHQVSPKWSYNIVYMKLLLSRFSDSVLEFIRHVNTCYWDLIVKKMAMVVSFAFTAAKSLHICVKLLLHRYYDAK